MDILLMLVIALLSAQIFAEFGKLFGIPRVVGQIAAGLVLSQEPFRSFLFSANNMLVLGFLANLGIILLFYYVGLETNFGIFRQHLKKGVLISLLNTSLPFLVGFSLMHVFFHFNGVVSAIVGVALAVSAQSVSVDILDELNMLKSSVGRSIVSAGAIDDVIELLMVSVLLTSLHIAFGDATFFDLIRNIGIFLLILLSARILFVPAILKFFEIEHSSTARFTGALVLVLLLASLADQLKIGALIGAMLAGVIVRRTIYKDVTIPDWEEHDIARSTHIIAFGFLIPLFFVWIGLQTDIHTIIQDPGLILLLASIATLGTVGGSALAIFLSGGSFKSGLTIGWGLNPKGDVELVIAALALQYGIITQELFTALVMMGMITTLISPIVFRRLVRKQLKK